MTATPKDPLHQRIVLGTCASAERAASRARETGTSLIIWRDDHIIEITPKELDQLQLPQNSKPEQR